MAQSSDVEQVNLRAVADVLRFWNTHDVAGVLNFYNDDIIWTNVALEEEYHGKTEVGGFIEKLIIAFPDLTFAVSHRIAHEDTVAEQWEIRGTHLGSFMNIPPTGKSIVISGMSMVEMRDGRFLRDHFYYDSLGVMRQMGLMPPLAMTETLAGRALLWAAVNRAAVAGLAGLFTLALFVARRSRSR